MARELERMIGTSTTRREATLSPKRGVASLTLTRRALYQATVPTPIALCRMDPTWCRCAR
jgi:hypothetical protein